MINRRLSQRDEQILDLLCEGLSNRDIGKRLDLKEGTVKNYVKHLLDISGQDNRTALVVWKIHQDTIYAS